MLPNILLSLYNLHAPYSIYFYRDISKILYFLSSSLHQKFQLKNPKTLEQKKKAQFTFKSITLMESINRFLFTPD